MIDRDKYITFKREDFERFIFGDPAPPYAKYQLEDAIVIRRRDFFAAPALNSYASSIAIAAQLLHDDALLEIADYFHEQAELAAEEGFKVPDA